MKKETDDNKFTMSVEMEKDLHERVMRGAKKLGVGKSGFVRVAAIEKLDKMDVK